MRPSGCIHTEDLCSLFDILSRDADKIRRDHLKKGEDYIWESGRHWFFPSGVDKIRSLVVEDKPAKPSKPPPPVEPEPDITEPAVLVIERLCPNPTWVQCRHEGRLVNVRVANNVTMRRGLPLTVVADGNGRYVAVRVRA
jgi:hypothetical protein